MHDPAQGPRKDMSKTLQPTRLWERRPCPVCSPRCAAESPCFQPPTRLRLDFTICGTASASRW
ncbi:unnamed protein product [Symbiodinium sp. KB8]|nr:unnamed protein product [Symbiodinium sp. KB8]